MPPSSLWASSTPHFVGLDGRHLAGGVGVDQVVALDAAGLAPAVLGVQHILQGCIQLAVDSGFQPCPAVRQAGFFFTPNVGTNTGKVCLFRVQDIVDTVIQAGPNRNDFVIGHYTASRTSRHTCCTNSDAAWISARVASPRALA